MIDPADSRTLSLPLDAPAPRRLEFAADNRRYCATLLPDLFGDWSVMQSWSNARSRRGGKIDRVDSFDAGVALLDTIAATRTRRGYRLIAQQYH